MVNNRYISSWNHVGWLARVPTSYTQGETPKKLQYKQRLFKSADYSGKASIALKHAKQWRDENVMLGLQYRDYKAAGDNRRLTSSRARIRGNDLPTGITDSQQLSKDGVTIQRMISVQVMFNRKSSTKSFSYGVSRDRDQAVQLAKEALIELVN
jgi:hypothetical protein